MSNHPNLTRREWLAVSAVATATGTSFGLCPRHHDRAWHAGSALDPTHAIFPVVGDGRWIWRDPPAEKGFLEPREYEVRVGVEATGRTRCLNFSATTVVPCEHPEQKIVESRLETDGCEAQLQTLSAGAAQLAVAAPAINHRQTIRAEAIFKIQLTKSFQGYRRESFTERLDFGSDIAREFLGDSPGIETRLPALKKIVAELSGRHQHPWDLAEAFHEWVHTQIEGVPMKYTSVKRALESRRGDCEERAGVFVALCRTAGIPARLVWVPNHAWAEFLLLDQSGQAVWIPAHTAAYSWFGWTGAHELVLQKGDRIRQLGMDKNVRLVADWWRYQGTQPHLKYFATLTPLPPLEGGDPGPGQREKQSDGQWLLTGDHRDQRYMRP